jgi:pimeloyl-ACP methyl ester carboxylesterase
MTALVPPGAEERYVDTQSGRLRVLHGGVPRDGHAPAVLLHGGGTDNAGISWYRLIEPLGHDREVWAIDLPGFGGSIAATPVGGPRELAATAADALQSLGVAPAVVFGISMGGDAALNLALDHPRLVAGLVLIGPGGLVPIFRNRMTHFWAWLAAQMPDWMLLPAGRLANRFAGTAIRAIVKDPRTLPAVVIEEFTREARDPRGGIGYARYNQATIGRHGMLNDLTETVQKITAPTLLFHGVDDPIVDPEGSRIAAECMPNAELVMVSDCGHWVQIEAHERVLLDTRRFLAKLDQGEGRACDQSDQNTQ